MGLLFLTPLAGVVLALAGCVPLGLLWLMRSRARRVREALSLEEPPGRTALSPFVALAGVICLLAAAAAQPVVQRTATRYVRADAEVLFVLDVSRSMLARAEPASRTRFERAKAVAKRLRASLPDVPAGLATFTDRTLPHLFPVAEEDVFAVTLDRAIGIERPPPESTFTTQTTSLDALAAIPASGYFSSSARRRLVIVLTDGESRPFSNRPGLAFREPPRTTTVLIRFWAAGERIYTREGVEQRYVSDPGRAAVSERFAAAVGGRLFPENATGDALEAARKALGEGPAVAEDRIDEIWRLAPYAALAAFVPLSLLLWRRDI